jgi:hypothetical protein
VRRRRLWIGILIARSSSERHIRRWDLTGQTELGAFAWIDPHRFSLRRWRCGFAFSCRAETSSSINPIRQARGVSEVRAPRILTRPCRDCCPRLLDLYAGAPAPAAFRSRTRQLFPAGPSPLNSPDAPAQFVQLSNFLGRSICSLQYSPDYALGSSLYDLYFSPPCAVLLPRVTLNGPILCAAE